MKLSGSFFLTWIPSYNATSDRFCGEKTEQPQRRIRLLSSHSTLTNITLRRDSKGQRQPTCRYERGLLQIFFELDEVILTANAIKVRRLNNKHESCVRLPRKLTLQAKLP